MANVKFQAPNPYSQQAADLNRRQKMAEMLQQQSMEPLQQQSAGGMVIPLNPLAGLAKVLQSYTSSRQLSDLDKKRAGLEAQDIKSAQEMLAQFRNSATEQPIAEGDNTLQELAVRPMPQSAGVKPVVRSQLMKAGLAPGSEDYEAASAPARLNELVSPAIPLAERQQNILPAALGAGVGPLQQKLAQMLYEKPETIAPLFSVGKQNEYTDDSVREAQEAQQKGDPNPRRFLVAKPTAVKPQAVRPATVLRNGRSVVIDANTGNEIGDAVVPRVPSEPLVPIYGLDGIPTLVTRANAVGKKPYTASTATQDLKEADRQRLATQASISTQDMLDNGAILISHPGRIAATGGSSRLSGIPGTDAYNFQARLDTFKSQTFLPMVSAMKGAGALSDAEGKKLGEAVGALDPKMTEDEFEKSLRSIIDRLYRNAIAGGLNVSMPPMPDSTLPPGFKLD